MNETISLRKFADIDLNDPFFDSLKEDYPGFEEWFDRKASTKAPTSLTPAPSPNGEGSEDCCLQMKGAFRWCEERLFS